MCCICFCFFDVSGLDHLVHDFSYSPIGRGRGKGKWHGFPGAADEWIPEVRREAINAVPGVLPPVDGFWLHGFARRSCKIHPESSHFHVHMACAWALSVARVAAESDASTESDRGKEVKREVDLGC